MSKLTRKFLKLFGSTSAVGPVGTGQITTFGSFAAGAGATTQDPAVIQSLSQWLEGWFSAVDGNNAFNMEDMNAFCYVVCYMLCNMLQDGIPYWETNTTYFKGSVVAFGGSYFRCINDTAGTGISGIATTNGAYWQNLRYIFGLNPQVNSTLANIAVTKLVAQTTPSGSWGSVCWSPKLRLFVCGGTGGASNSIMTSPDGVTWTTRTTPGNVAIGNICWAPGLQLFVAISNTTNAMMTSPDGVTWTSRAIGTSGMVTICWSPELQLLVAVGFTGSSNVLTSPDGITWTARTPANTNTHWWSVAWSAEVGLFVACGDQVAGSQYIMTSPDGITWTGRALAASTVALHSIVWAKELGLFVGAAYDNGITNDTILTSPDGINWTPQATAVNERIETIVWAPELGLLITGQDSCIQTSLDGITWSVNANSQIESIAWAPQIGIFACTYFNIGASEFQIATSTYVKNLIA
jgi:hypothetical protein